MIYSTESQLRKETVPSQKFDKYSVIFALVFGFDLKTYFNPSAICLSAREKIRDAFLQLIVDKRPLSH